MLNFIELFAGVGGFRLGLEESGFKCSWSNQWEPSTKTQHASDIYVKKFGAENHSNEDIEKVIKDNPESIPKHDLLCGGFPCQNYSIASTNAKGLVGEKGVLWWSIYNIIKQKGDLAPNYLMLENVDRLINSPSKYRGRDFSTILSSLNSMGYFVEWRIINASEYGMPQRRKRIYMMAYRKGSPVSSNSVFSNHSVETVSDWIKNGVMGSSFPIKDGFNIDVTLDVGTDFVSVSNDGESFDGKKRPYSNAGIMIDGKVYTGKVDVDYDGDYTVMRDIIISEEDVPEEFFIKDDVLGRWEYLKGGKKEKRIASNGFEYNYSEGPVGFPDSLEKASRTIITGEGGPGPSRFKHVIKTESGRLRRLVPIELERLNMFPDNHTEGVSDSKRAFLMGNALVIGVVERLSESLDFFHNKQK